MDSIPKMNNPALAWLTFCWVHNENKDNKKIMILERY